MRILQCRWLNDLKSRLSYQIPKAKIVFVRLWAMSLIQVKLLREAATMRFSSYYGCTAIGRDVLVIDI